MTTPANHSIAQLAAIVRSMPIAEARRFLAELMPTFADVPDVAPLRAVHITLNECDAQLELIAAPQARLAL